MRKFSLSLYDWCISNNRTDILQELCKEFDPKEIGYGSSKMLKWKCSTCGYIWDAPANRRTMGHGCPYCNGKIVIKGKNDFKTLHPELILDWHDEKTDPSNVAENSAKKVQWKCHKCGHIWFARISSRVLHSKCPCCETGRSLKVGVNDLFTKMPYLKEEWDYEKNIGIDPYKLLTQSNQKIHWKCKKCGGEWESTVLNRKRGRNCPYCAGMKVLAGYNDLDTKRPDIASEWDYEKNGEMTPKDVTCGSSKIVYWKKGDKRWKSAVNKRTYSRRKK